MSKFMTTAARRSQRSKPRWKPHKYQLKGAQFLVAHAAAGLLLDPGLGKTSITLAAITTLIEQGICAGVLVLAPLRVAQSVWPEEIEGWADFAGLTHCVLHGKNKEELVLQKHDVYVINYEGLKWLIESGHLKRLLRESWVDTLVCDELSKLKHGSSQRFKLLKPWLPKFARRWGLTGSPASNGLLDLWGQMYILDQGRSLGAYITHFRAQYCVPEGDYGWRLRAGADEEIIERVRPMVLRMAAEDYLDLPQVITRVHKVTLPPAARQLYDQFERDLVAGLRSGVITAANEAVASAKLRQIASGAVYYTEGDPIVGTSRRAGYEELHREKLEYLQELLDELQGAPLLLAYEFQHDYARIAKMLGAENAPTVSGSTEKTLATLRNKWNAGEMPLLCMNPASGGHGLNMQKGSAANVGFFSMPWDYELYDQFIRRVLRQGNKSKHVTVHHFVARDTIEELRVAVALRVKERTQNAFFEALRGELLRSRS
jgi:SNF2 family DNA or RNA helicase